MMVLITLACCEGSDEPACTHDLVRAFASMQVEEDSEADLLALICGVFCEFVTFPLVSWVRCGT